MPAPELTLHVDAAWESPWAFHAFVALDEKQLEFELVPEPLPLSDERRAELAALGMIGKVPMLVHRLGTGDHAFTESLAISEYLAETFPFPANPRLFPADLAQRSRARQVMSWLRTSLMALRAERPTSRVFDPAPEPSPPLSAAAQAHAGELLGVAGRLITPDRESLFDAWCIADADLALALMRMVVADDELPAHLSAYARAVWGRPSVRRFVEYAHAERGGAR